MSIKVEENGAEYKLQNKGSFTHEGVSYTAYRTNTQQASGTRSWVVTVN